MAHLEHVGKAHMATVVFKLKHWLLAVPTKPNMVTLLIFVNLGGAIYGFQWYAAQLATTPLKYLLVVPDSPGSTLLFGLMLVTFKLRKRWAAFEGLVYPITFKYGLWTPIVLIQAMAATGNVNFEGIHLSLSHAGMALESVLFVKHFSPARKYFLIGLTWSLFNDYMDYIVGTHPTLPAPEYTWFAAAAAGSLSLASFIVLQRLSGEPESRKVSSPT